MNSITIVGGGLAGLALGIGLRQRDIPVTIWEAGQYPRQKVCGEFISGRGQGTLERLQLRDKIIAAGGRWATTAAFYTTDGRHAGMALPQPALCVSRYRLDALLAEEFQNRGGELRVRQRWSNGFTEPGLIRATGHRVQARDDGWRWIGLKIHARRMELKADLELHFQPNGYIGVCRLRDTVNICGLFRTREPIHDLRRHWQEMLCGRFGTVELEEESFQAVAGLSYEPRAAGENGECALGDALSLIPPATGNGMSIALESAELALEPLVRFSRGKTGWEECRGTIAASCRRRLESRLRFARWLHSILFQATPQRWLMRTGCAFPAVLRYLFAQTR